MARKRDFGTAGIFSEFTQTASYDEAIRIANQIIDEGYQAKITRVTEPIPRGGTRTYYTIWQRGKPSRKGVVGWAITERIFGPQVGRRGEL
jgi:hypothetical protein